MATRTPQSPAHHRHQYPSPPGVVLGDRIGKGSFATVYKGKLASDGTVVAIKIVQRAHLKRDKRLLDNFEAEMAILKRMKHPHVVSLIEVIQTNADFNLVMEYCSLGDLSRFIRKRATLAKTLPVAADMFAKWPCPADLGLHDVVVRHFLAQLASSLAFLREHDLIHRDIKPQNLLLRPPPASEAEARQLGFAGRWDLPVLKIADFGFARFLPAASMAETLCGSPLYMAPEILHYEKYNAKADLWSTGAVAYEMAVGKPPFPAANHMELIKKIDETKDQIKFPPTLPHDIVDIISRLLRRSPAERMSFSEFFAHPAVTAYSPASVDSLVTPATPATPPPQLQTQPQPQPIGTASFHSSEDSQRLSSPPATPVPATPTMSGPGFRSTPFRAASSSGSGMGFTGIPEEAIESSPSPSPSASPSPPTSPGASSATRAAGRSSRSSGVGLGRDSYVVIEKRTVEVNALADTLARVDLPSRGDGGRGSHGAGSAGSAGSTGAAGAARAARRRLSSIAYGASPTTALAQALLKSSARLFGPTSSQRRSSSSSSSDIRSGALRDVIDELEQLATIGKVVSLYADVKYAQLPPESLRSASPPASVGPVSPAPTEGMSASVVEPPMIAEDEDSILRVAQEALALYLKALGVLAQAMDRAADWWDPAHPEALAGVGQLVQWIRDKFNECVDRAEVARSLCDSLGSSRAGPITAEKLLFDRAAEMSRAAAVQEQAAGNGPDAAEVLSTSEMNYGTAVWMLKALLVPSDDSSDDSTRLSMDDRTMVNQMMAKIGERVAGLRRRRSSSSERQRPQLTPER